MSSLRELLIKANSGNLSLEEQGQLLEALGKGFQELKTKDLEKYNQMIEELTQAINEIRDGIKAER